MRHGLKFAGVVACFALGLGGSAWAGSFEDGQAAYSQGDYSTGMRILLPLAEHGDARAQYMVGLAYGLGHGAPQSYTEAAKWYKRAAEQGNAGAEANLGALYASGHSVPEDYAEAIKWWRRAAD